MFINTIQLRFILVVLGISSCAFFCCAQSDGLETSSILKTHENNVHFLDTLKLTPNESFFSPVGTLRAHLLDKSSGNPYNKMEFYDYIYDWKEVQDTILFGINLEKKGDLSVVLTMEVPQNQSGSTVRITLGSQKQDVKLVAGEESKFTLQKGLTFRNISAGFHLLKLQLKTLVNSGESVGKLSQIQLYGTASKNATVEMRRYRPFAVHCKWENPSGLPVEISVHELTVVNRDVNCYQPITTPFGYTGSPWSLKTNSFKGYNFSLWSYGANDPPPPFYQESHLIAVGPGLIFGSYGHEGTGVKPRGDHPYIDTHTNTQVIAVRKVPGPVYDTYWSYYLDPNDGHWKLYGCGKKFNKSGKIEYLKTGAFVEVAGPASVERSGHEIRESRYSGWQMDNSGKWHAIHKMVGTSASNDLSFREWSIVDNQFSMKMGGWGTPGNEKVTLTLDQPKELPPYLKGEYVQELYAMPATFNELEPLEVNSTSVTLQIDMKNIGSNATGTVYWGIEEGLTKEAAWANKMSFTVNKGLNTIVLKNLDSDTKYFYRIKVKNREGITWSYNTLSFKTK